MKMFRFCLLVLLGLIAYQVADTNILATLSIIFVILVLALNWSVNGKLPDVKDNSSKFDDEE